MQKNMRSLLTLKKTNAALDVGGGSSPTAQADVQPKPGASTPVAAPDVSSAPLCATATSAPSTVLAGTSTPVAAALTAPAAPAATIAAALPAPPGIRNTASSVNAAGHVNVSPSCTMPLLPKVASAAKKPPPPPVSIVVAARKRGRRKWGNHGEGRSRVSRSLSPRSGPADERCEHHTCGTASRSCVI